MKKCRFIGIIVVLVILMMIFTGCEDENVRVLIKNTDSTITVNTNQWCQVDLTIKVNSDGKVDTITKKFEFKKGETRTLTIQDFVADYYGDEAVITEVTNGVPYNLDENGGIVALLILVLLIVAISCIAFLGTY